MSDFVAEFLASTPPPGNPDCTNPECGFYPYYGVAPHECFYKRGPEFKIGQSVMLPRALWPKNFVLDLEPGEDPDTVQYPSATGVYFCPTCLSGMPPEPSATPPNGPREGDGAAGVRATPNPQGEDR